MAEQASTPSPVPGPDSEGGRVFPLSHLARSQNNCPTHKQCPTQPPRKHFCQLNHGWPGVAGPYKVRDSVQQGPGTFSCYPRNDRSRCCSHPQNTISQLSERLSLKARGVWTDLRPHSRLSESALTPLRCVVKHEPEEGWLAGGFYCFLVLWGL